MLPALAVAAAVAVAVTQPAEACGGGFIISSGQLGVLAALATITLPLWIVPVAGYGLVVGAAVAADKIKDSHEHKKALAEQLATATRSAESLRMQPIFAEGEKNPTPTNLMRIGVCMFQSGDGMTARGFLRRAIAMAEAIKDPTPADTAVLLVCAYTSGLIDMSMQLFAGAAHNFQTALRLQDAMATAAVPAPAAGAAGTEGGATIDRCGILNLYGWALLHKALYAPSDASEAEVNAAIEALSAAAALAPGDAEIALRAATAKYYKHIAHSTDAAGQSALQSLVPIFDRVADTATPLSNELRSVAAWYASSTLWALRRGDDAKARKQRALELHPSLNVSANRFHVSDDWSHEWLLENLSAPWPLPPLVCKAGVSPHTWERKSFHRPSFCGKCQKLVTLAQNYAKDKPYACTSCNYRCHAECHSQLADAMCPNRHSAEEKAGHQHIMRPRTLHSPHSCGLCGDFCWSTKVMSCESCGLIVHKDCVAKLTNAVVGPAATDS